MSKIQFDDEGRVPALPVKSSAQTCVQPESGGGTDASAVWVRGAITSTAAAVAPRANLRRDGARVLGMGGDLLVTLGQGSECPLGAADVAASHGSALTTECQQVATFRRASLPGVVGYADAG